MDEPTSRRGRRLRRDRPERSSGRCPLCGGPLSVLVEVPSRGQPYEQDRPVTKYFRCLGCNQIQIVDE